MSDVNNIVVYGDESWPNNYDEKVNGGEGLKKMSSRSRFTAVLVVRIESKTGLALILILDQGILTKH